MYKITQDLKLQNFSSMQVANENNVTLYEVFNQSDLEEFLKFVHMVDLKYLVLGCGTNSVFISNKIQNILKLNFQEIEIQADIMKVGAGVLWDVFVKKFLEMGGVGMEALSAIPGTVGASPVQNIGAYGKEVSEFIESVEVYDNVNKTFKKIASSECEFAYRDSLFKKNPNRFLILSVTFSLNVNTPIKLPNYKDLNNYFKNKSQSELANLTTSEIRNAVIDIRSGKFPNILEVPNCGSFFKNPFINRNQLKAIQIKMPEVPVFGEGEIVKIPLAYILEKLNLKGKKVGNFAMYENHALILTNFGHGDSKEFLSFVEHTKSLVKENYDIEIDTEVNIF